MNRFDPYYAEDTDGVHFEVEVEGHWVLGYVGRKTLHQVYGPIESQAQCLATYLEHRAEIDAAARRRVLADGPESVLLRRDEIVASPNERPCLEDPMRRAG